MPGPSVHILEAFRTLLPHGRRHACCRFCPCLDWRFPCFTSRSISVPRPAPTATATAVRPPWPPSARRGLAWLGGLLSTDARKHFSCSGMIVRAVASDHAGFRRHIGRPSTRAALLPPARVCLASAHVYAVPCACAHGAAMQGARWHCCFATGPVQSRIRVPLFAASTLNATGQSRVTLSLR